MNDLEVFVNPVDYGDSVEITFYRKTDADVVIYYFNKDGFIEPEHFPTGSASNITRKPSFSIPNEWAQALTDALNKKGIKPESEFKIHALYEAQTKHLEDIRKLIFEKRVKVCTDDLA